MISNPFASEEKDSDTLNISINLKTGVIKTRIDVGNVPGHCGC